MDLPIAFSTNQLALNPHNALYASTLAALAADSGRLENNSMSDFASIMFWKLEALEAKRIEGKISSETHHTVSILALLSALLPARPLPVDPHGLITLKATPKPEEA